MVFESMKYFDNRIGLFVFLNFIGSFHEIFSCLKFSDLNF